MVAWNFAFAYPQMVDRLIVMNLPHPNGLIRELTINAEQRAQSGYVQTFQNGSPSIQPDPARPLIQPRHHLTVNIPDQSVLGSLCGVAADLSFSGLTQCYIVAVYVN